jgi:hypothetical protein
MAAPNLFAPTTCTAVTTVVKDCSTTVAAIISNATSSGKSFFVESLVITNKHASSTSTVDVEVYDGAVSYFIIKGITMAVGATLQVIDKNRPLTLIEGQSLRIDAGTSNILDAVCSHLEIS